MTSLDPSHLPFLSGHATAGQAVHTGVRPVGGSSASQAVKTAAQDDDDDSDDDSIDTSAEAPFWKGAWARRQAERKARLARDLKEKGKVPVPPIPDLRFEQGYLASIRPFLHPGGRQVPSNQGASTSTLPPPADLDEKATEDEEHAEKHEVHAQAEQKGALVSAKFTAEGAGVEGQEDGQENSTDLFTGPLEVEWGKVAYVTLRDQLLFPALQGAVWYVGGLYIAAIWGWGRGRQALEDANRGKPQRAGAGLFGKNGPLARLFGGGR